MSSPASLVSRERPSAGDGTYLDLARQAREAGLFRRPPPSAAARFALVGLAYGAGWAAVVLIGDSWYQLLVAFYLALVFAQVGFLAHDIGHRQFSWSPRWNDVVGLVCANLGSGLSFGYWVSKHNQHHARPNEVGADPDVAPGAVSWTAGQAANRTGVSGFVALHQAALFFPLLTLEALNLHVSSVRSLRSTAVRHPVVEAVMLALHAAAYLAAVLLVLSPWRALAFVAVQQGVLGLYLGAVFAPNHKGMRMPDPGERLDFVHRQVTTARNVRGGRALTLAMGGLNYQIEHHLFPTMPMANLRRCQPMVRAYCSAHGMDYCEASLPGSYLAALRHLRNVGRSVGRVQPRHLP